MWFSKTGGPNGPSFLDPWALFNWTIKKYGTRTLQQTCSPVPGQLFCRNWWQHGLHRGFNIKKTTREVSSLNSFWPMKQSNISIYQSAEHIRHALYSVNCIFWIVFCELYYLHVFNRLFSMYCILFIVFYALFSMYFIICFVLYELYI